MPGYVLWVRVRGLAVLFERVNCPLMKEGEELVSDRDGEKDVPSSSSARAAPTFSCIVLQVIRSDE